MSRNSVHWLFLVAGFYDFVVGVAFLFFGPKLFELTKTTPPNHWGYVQFASLMLIIFGLMFFAVAHAPIRNHNLILYGMLLKLSFVGVVVYYWATTDCPRMFKPFAVIDAVMFVLFAIAYRTRFITWSRPRSIGTPAGA